MENLIYSRLLRRSLMILAGTALSITALYSNSPPTLSNTNKELIVQKIEDLKEAEENWIQIDLATQRLIAWEGKKPVYAITVSTGKRATPTRVGTFQIQSKHRYARMRGADYDVPNVPYTMYYKGGYAIHGAYWHRRFGTPVSHGCINVAVNHSKWLFKWAKVGTSVVIHK